MSINTIIKRRNLKKAEKHGIKSAKTLLMGVVLYGMHNKREDYHFLEFIVPLTKGRVGWSLSDGKPIYRNSKSFDPIQDKEIIGLEDLISKIIETEVEEIYYRLPYVDEAKAIAKQAAINYVKSKKENIPFKVVGKNKAQAKSIIDNSIDAENDNLAKNNISDIKQEDIEIISSTTKSVFSDLLLLLKNIDLNAQDTMTLFSFTFWLIIFSKYRIQKEEAFIKKITKECKVDLLGHLNSILSKYREDEYKEKEIGKIIEIMYENFPGFYKTNTDGLNEDVRKVAMQNPDIDIKEVLLLATMHYSKFIKGYLRDIYSIPENIKDEIDDVGLIQAFRVGGIEIT